MGEREHLLPVPCESIEQVLGALRECESLSPKMQVALAQLEALLEDPKVKARKRWEGRFDGARGCMDCDACGEVYKDENDPSGVTCQSCEGDGSISVCSICCDDYGDCRCTPEHVLRLETARRKAELEDAHG